MSNSLDKLGDLVVKKKLCEVEDDRVGVRWIMSRTHLRYRRFAGVLAQNILKSLKMR